MTVITTPSPTASELLQNSSRITKLNKLINVYVSDLFITPEQSFLFHHQIEGLRSDCRVFNMKFKQEFVIP